MEKARVIAQIRALQRIADELAGMVLSMDEPQKKPPEIPAPAAPEEARDIMSARQVQAFLGIGESTFYTWIREGRLPPGEVWGKKLRRWRREDILNWGARQK